MSQNHAFESLFPRMSGSINDSEQLVKFETVFDSENLGFNNSEDLFSQLNGNLQIKTEKNLITAFMSTFLSVIPVLNKIIFPFNRCMHL